MRSWRRQEQAAIFSCLVPPCRTVGEKVSACTNSPSSGHAKPQGVSRTMLTKKPQRRCRHEFPPSSVLRAEHQVALGQGTTFSSHSEANSYVSYLLLHVFGDPRRSYSAAT